MKHNKDVMPDAAAGSAEVNKKKISRKTAVLLIVAAVILVVMCITVSVLMKQSSYEKVVEEYMDAHIALDYDPVLDIRSGFYDAAILTQNEKAAALITGTKDAMRAHKDRFTKALGEGYTVSYEITSSKKMDRAVFESMVNAFTILGYDARTEIRDAMFVDVTLTAEYNGKSASADVSLILTKEPEGWRFFGVEGVYQ